MQSTLASEMCAAISRALDSIPFDQRRDVYALSFYISYYRIDSQVPSLIVGYNTNQQWRDSIADASSSDEAKWNYAFWLQNELWATGQGEWADRIEAWLRTLGLWHTAEEEDTDFDRDLEPAGKIDESFVALVCDVAAKLHETGTIVAVFGRPVPIIVHELEYYDAIADQTARANPPGLADEFVSWVWRGCP